MELEEAIDFIKIAYGLQKTDGPDMRGPQGVAWDIICKELDSIGEIKRVCLEYFNYINSDDFNEDGTGDHENAIFEAAMEHFHGAGIWNTINLKLLQKLQH
ncbi:MAG: hypothetical protein KC517_09295 [Bacteroidetes bacterium]|nr:hypothetical protein [Bacteroidota bacterium]